MSAPTTTKKVLFISTWAPPMMGGPRNLYIHMTATPQWDPKSYDFLTCYHNFSWSELDPTAWLPCDYHYFDYHGIAPRDVNKVIVAPDLIKWRKLDRIDDKVRHWLRWLPQKNRYVEILLDMGSQFKWALRVTLSTLKLNKVNRYSKYVLISDMGWGMVGGFLASVLTRKKFDLYLFDLYADNHMLGANRIYAKLFEPWLFRFSDRIILTNERTKLFYRTKYPGIPESRYVIVYNSTDSAPRKIDAPIVAPAKPRRIVFTGSIYWPQEESVHNVVKAVLSAGERLDLRLDLYAIYCPESIKADIAKSDRIFVGKIPKVEVADRLASAALTLIPFGFNTYSPDIIRTASPAKLGEYLAAGLPILVHAPEDSFVARFVRENQCGLAVTTSSVDVLVNELEKYFGDFEANYVRDSSNAIQASKKYFDLAANSKRLHDAVFG